MIWWYLWYDRLYSADGSPNNISFHFIPCCIACMGDDSIHYRLCLLMPDVDDSLLSLLRNWHCIRPVLLLLTPVPVLTTCRPHSFVFIDLYHSDVTTHSILRPVISPACSTVYCHYDIRAWHFAVRLPPACSNWRPPVLLMRCRLFCWPFFYHLTPFVLPALLPNTTLLLLEMMKLIPSRGMLERRIGERAILLPFLVKRHFICRYPTFHML